jgi:hypothetical protein
MEARDIETAQGRPWLVYDYTPWSDAPRLLTPLHHVYRVVLQAYQERGRKFWPSFVYDKKRSRRSYARLLRVAYRAKLSRDAVLYRRLWLLNQDAKLLLWIAKRLDSSLTEKECLAAHEDVSNKYPRRALR